MVDDGVVALVRAIDGYEGRFRQLRGALNLREYLQAKPSGADEELLTEPSSPRSSKTCSASTRATSFRNSARVALSPTSRRRISSRIRSSSTRRAQASGWASGLPRSSATWISARFATACYSICGSCACIRVGQRSTIGFCHLPCYRCGRPRTESDFQWVRTSRHSVGSAKPSLTGSFRRRTRSRTSAATTRAAAARRG